MTRTAHLTDTTFPDATMRYGATARQVADVFEPMARGFSQADVTGHFP